MIKYMCLCFLLMSCSNEILNDYEYPSIHQLKTLHRISFSFVSDTYLIDLNDYFVSSDKSRLTFALKRFETRILSASLEKDMLMLIPKDKGEEKITLLVRAKDTIEEKELRVFVY